MKTITVRNAYRFTLLCLVLLAGIAQAEIETITYLHSDHLGSPVLARDNQGNTLWREDYSPWGERLTRPSGNSADIGYTGHYEETDIGLTYAQARWYDPQVGRFLAPDAVDFTSGGAAHFNRYVYANDNPLRFIDLDGRDSREAAFAALGDVDYNARGANAAQGVANGMAAFGDAVDYAVEPSAASVFGGVLGKLGLRFLPKRKVSEIDDIAKPGSRLRNIRIDVSKSDFEANLLDNGFKKSMSKDGSVSIFTYGNKKYTTRDFSRSTDGPTAEVFIDNKPVSKIRLGD